MSAFTGSLKFIVGRFTFFLVLLFCINIYSQNLQDSVSASSYFNKALKFQDESKYDSANINFEFARKYYQEISDWDKVVSCYNKMGECFKNDGKNQQADSILSISLDTGLKKLGDENVNVINTYIQFGSLYNTKGEYKKALVSVNTALKYLEMLPNKNEIALAKAYYLLGLINQSLGNYDESLKNHFIALKINKQHFGNFSSEVGTNYNSIGEVYEAFGDFDKALTFMENALEIKLKTAGENHHETAVMYNNIASIYFYKEDIDLSLEYYFKSLSIDKQLLTENNPTFGFKYNNIAMAYRKKGDYSKSLEFSNKSKNIFVKNFGELHPNVAAVVNNMGRTFTDMKDYDNALNSYLFAINIWKLKLGENHPITAQGYYNIGEIYLLKNKLRKAYEFLLKSLDIRLRALGNKNLKVAESFNQIANFYLESKEIDSALIYYQKGIIAVSEKFDDLNVSKNPDLQNILSETTLLEILSNKAKALREKYLTRSLDTVDLILSLNAYNLAAKLITKLRYGYRFEESKLALENNAYKILNNAIATSFLLYNKTGDAKYKESAFRFSEENKSGVLLDAISGVNALKYSGIPDSLLQKEKNIKLNLRRLDTQLLKEKQKPGKADSLLVLELQNQFFDYDNKYVDLIKYFEKNYHRYYDLKYQSKDTEIDEIQKHIPENTSIIEYSLNDSAIFVFVISSRNLNIQKIPLKNSLTESVLKFRKSLTSLEFEEYANESYKLYETLIKPIEKKLKGMENIIIIPEAILNYLPFEALITKKIKGDINFSTLPYLLKKYNISYHFSSAFLEKLSPNPKQKSNNFFGVAPVFDINSELDNSTIDSTFKMVTRSTTVEGKTFGALPESESEVKGILKLFTQKKNSGRVLLRSSATEAAIKSADLSNYNFIHFATHGFINENTPKLSGFIFNRDNDSEQDGILYLNEIYNLNLNADIATLSACESGLGKIVNGEGIIGMTRGFIYAGAKNVLVSLWQVADKSTSYLMLLFYKNILNGMGYSNSLRMAKIQLINSKKYSYPLEWAPFILVGGR